MYIYTHIYTENVCIHIYIYTSYHIINVYWLESFRGIRGTGNGQRRLDAILLHGASSAEGLSIRAPQGFRDLGLLYESCVADDLIVLSRLGVLKLNSPPSILEQPYVSQQNTLNTLESLYKAVCTMAG